MGQALTSVGLGSRRNLSLSLLFKGCRFQARAISQPSETHSVALFPAFDDSTFGMRLSNSTSN